MTPEEMYSTSRMVWKVFAERAGWHGRIDPYDAVQVAVMRCWEVRHLYNAELSSKATFFSLAARHAISGEMAKTTAQKRTAPEVSIDSGEYVVGGIDLTCPRRGPAEIAERRDTIAWALRTLPNAYSDILQGYLDSTAGDSGQGQDPT